MSPDTQTLLAHSSVLQSYYSSLESRIGYRLFLNDTRHFGYYPSSTSFPFPISRSLRAMEAQLFAGLACPPFNPNTSSNPISSCASTSSSFSSSSSRNSRPRILDAGCGVGHVALYMASRGNYTIDCIDIVAHHVSKARRNIRAAGREGQISARLGDYHDLREFEDGIFDGVYTMETLVHATDPARALDEFRRVLKPGGRIAMNEYDHLPFDGKREKGFERSMKTVNTYAAMPANEGFEKDRLKELLIEAGFEDVELRDMSENIVPMLRLFWIFAIVPYLIVRFLGIERHFVNTVAGAESYRGRHVWRYVQVTGRKPA